MSHIGIDPRFQGGYIRLWRSLRENETYRKARHPWRSVMIEILLTANWEPKPWYDGKTSLSLVPGMLVTSLQHLAEHSDVSIQNVRSALTYLSRCGFLTHSSTSRYTVLTVCNWGTYQNVIDDVSSPANTTPTRRSHSAHTPLTTTKEDKNQKNTTTPSSARANSVITNKELPETQAASNSDSQGGQANFQVPGTAFNLDIAVQEIWEVWDVRGRKNWTDCKQWYGDACQKEKDPFYFHQKVLQKAREFSGSIECVAAQPGKYPLLSWWIKNERWREEYERPPERKPLGRERSLNRLDDESSITELARQRRQPRTPGTVQ